MAIDEILRYRGTRFPGSRTLCHPVRDDDYRSAGSPKTGCRGKDGGQSGGKALVPRFFGITRRQLESSPNF